MGKNVIRKRKLSSGWYPESPDIINRFINSIIENTIVKSSNKIAAIIPHAGWDYSGSLAVKSIYQLYPNPDTVVIIGGHLPPGAPLYYSSEDIYETPIGNLVIDKSFNSGLLTEFEIIKDLSSDNTVEVIIPIVKYFFPNSKILCLRVGSGAEAIKLGILIHKISLDLNKKIIVLGSTDLTHYGRSFSFLPRGTGEKAVQWVKNVNDRDIVDKMLKMDFQGVLDSANKNFSACSSGAASSAIRFASLSKVKSGSLIGYLNSYDITPSESFVGYVGITY